MLLFPDMQYLVMNVADQILGVFVCTHAYNYGLGGRQALEVVWVNSQGYENFEGPVNL